MKEEKHEKKGIICFLVCTMMITLFFGTTASAISSKIIQSGHDAVKVSLIGYISFLKGVLWFPDKITYQATLSGENAFLVIPEAEDIKVYVTPKTDCDSPVGSVFLYFGKSTVEGTNVECKRGGSKGILEMYCVGNEYTLESAN